MAVHVEVEGGFGARLRRAREARGVSLRQIAETTKLSVSVLESLERNDLSRLPGGIFTRAFVRAYAVEVGLDPETAVEEFMRAVPRDSASPGSPHIGALDEHAAGDGRRAVGWTALAVLVLLVIVAVLMAFPGR